MNPSLTPGELMSALADGQLSNDEVVVAIHTCSHDNTALGCWNTYHLIGDVLRSPANSSALGLVGSELEFVSRLNNRLLQEAMVVAQPAAPERALAKLLQNPPREAASNDANFRWKLVAGLASLAAVSAVAWNLSNLWHPADSPQMARVDSVPITVASPQGVMVRDARLEEFLAAHKQFGSTSALQESSGFLRSVTFEAPQDGQSIGGR
ncbi:MAG: anti sigma-E protein RseA [Polaromonas sp.]|nr:anti sigma-E protein RseA [Polaromonas sp.]